jgi:hypothetical protein
MSAEQRLAELRKSAPIGHRRTLVDYEGGEPGWTYSAVEFGPSQVSAEQSLRARGYEIAPESDPVNMLICSGMIRVQNPTQPGQYRVWRVPAEWAAEQLRQSAPQRTKPKMSDIDKLRAQLAAMEQMV